LIAQVDVVEDSIGTEHEQALPMFKHHMLDQRANGSCVELPMSPITACGRATGATLVGQNLNGKLCRAAGLQAPRLHAQVRRGRHVNGDAGIDRQRGAAAHDDVCGDQIRAGLRRPSRR
jgi:hypothetical protein